MVKNLVGVVPNANGTYTVNYAIVVNQGEAEPLAVGSLKGHPQFEGP